MAKRSGEGKRKRSRGKGNGTFLLVAVIVVLALATAALVGRSYASHRLLVPLSLFALIAGMLFEYRRIARKWSTVLWTALGSYVGSFLVFLPGKREGHYDIEKHIEMWPYLFCMLFVLVAVMGHKDRVTARLSEGMTLLQTLAIIYWCIDAGALEIRGAFTTGLLVLFGLFALHAVVHAFLPLALTRPSRLWLSLWSSSVMLFLTIDNIRQVYGLGHIETAEHWTASVLIVVNYFLLGVSSIYMAQNAMMLLGFLPGRGTFFNKAYFKEIGELKRDHIRRYSSEQAPFGVALLCLLFAGAVFGMNHHWQWVRSNFAIWAVFVSFPLLLSILRILPGTKRVGLTR